MCKCEFESCDDVALLHPCVSKDGMGSSKSTDTQYIQQPWLCTCRWISRERKLQCCVKVNSLQHIDRRQVSAYLP
ncbi:unnamed protein product [Arctia plantaginis]|uniref:Uncharacterized protein n=1 Tax=Arctia plantaginis TaxID=874455 RepID=A0A8S1AX71_ARCPL|nr:unnamed protein product [Arctia plantaginis]